MLDERMISQLLRQQSQPYVSFHIDQCFSDLAADSFSRIRGDQRLPLALEAFSAVKSQADELGLFTSLLVRTESETAHDRGLAMSYHELLEQLASENPPQMPPVVMVYSGTFPEGDILADDPIPFVLLPGSFDHAKWNCYCKQRELEPGITTYDYYFVPHDH